MKTYYTIYKITNNVNGNIYIGMHQTKNLDDGYYGSGLLIRRAIEKYGIENFSKEYISICDDRAEMIDLEKELVNEDFINRDDTYNIRLGGHGGFDHISTKDKKINGAKGNLTQLQKRRTDSDYNMRIFKLRSQKTTERNKNGTFGNPQSFKGKHHTQETKDKIGEANSKHQSGIGNSQYGTYWIHNLEIKQSKRILKDESIPNGWIKGRKIKF